MSPTSPMIVRTTPLLTKASPPTLSTFSTTRSTSSAVASGVMTMTMVFLSVCAPDVTGPGSAGDPLHAKRPCRDGQGRLVSVCGDDLLAGPLGCPGRVAEEIGPRGLHART